MKLKNFNMRFENHYSQFYMIIRSIIREEKMKEIYEVVFAITILHIHHSITLLLYFLLELLLIELRTIFCNY